MKINILVLFVTLNIISTIQYLLSDPPGKDKHCTLTVEGDGLRNSTGLLRVALYNKDGSIPDEHFRNYFKLGSTTIKSNKAHFTFTDLPPGNYAVSILHDENENWKIDKNFLKPKEGVGFSNIKTIGLGNRPNFKKASFSLSKDSNIVIKVIYI